MASQTMNVARRRIGTAVWKGSGCRAARSCARLPTAFAPPARFYSNETPAKPAQNTKTLADILADSIRASGPLSVSTFMRTCLLDPVQGYYATANTPPGTFDALTETRDVLGARGDFITSPEVSQVFGELLAIFFVARWQNTARDAPLRLVELGPGKGTLLADMLRTFARFAPFFRSIKDIHLVETSPGLMELQYNAIEKALEGTGKKLIPADQEVLGEDEIRVEWFPLVDSVPIRSDSWTMVAAHEFFDALPTHIFEVRFVSLSFACS